MKPLVIAVAFLLVGVLCDRGAEEDGTKESGQQFWQYHVTKDGFLIAHGCAGQTLSPADLDGRSIEEFLAKDTVKKQSLASLRNVTRAEASRYYGWSLDRLKAKWGLPISIFTVSAPDVAPTERRRPTHTIYSGGRRIDLCVPGDSADVAPHILSFRMLVYGMDDENELTGFFIYGKGTTVSGGLFKGVPILNPKGQQKAEDSHRQEKEKAQLLSWAHMMKKWLAEWPETATRINAEIEERRRAQAEDSGL